MKSCNLWPHELDLEGIMLSEIGQTEKDKYYMNSLIWGIKKHRLTDTENILVVARGQGGGQNGWRES